MMPGSEWARDAVQFLGGAAVKSSVVLMVSFAVMRRRGASAATRHAILAAAVATAVLVPAGQLALPAWRVAILPAERSTATPVVAAAGRLDEVPVIERAGARADAATLAATAGPRVAGDEAVGDIAGADATTPTRFAAPIGWPNIASAIWLLGAGLALLPWLLGVWRRRNLWRQATAELPAGWRDAWRYLPTYIDRNVSIRASDLTAVPMTWGVAAPVILVPLAQQWTASERRSALLHELAHIARFDTVWQGLSRVMLALFWFNPLAWIADALLRAESERACDDAVLRAGARASEYAQQLLDVLRHDGECGLHAVAAMSMARRSGMASRLQALLDASQKRSRLPRRLRTSLIAASAVVAVPLARLTPVPVSAASAVGRATELAGEKVTAAPTRPPVTDVLVSRSIAAPGTIVGPLGTAGSSTLVPQASTDVQQGDCLALRGSSASSMNLESSDGRMKRTRVKWSTGGCRVSFILEGDVTLNAEATDVVALSPGGSLELEVKDREVTRRVQLDEKRGTLEREFWVNGERAAWGADASAWFSRALVALDRRTAFAADQRLPVLLRKGGVEAALTEIETMDSDYAQRIYYTKLFKLQPLSIAQVRRVLAHVGTSLSSDYERAELLLAIASLDVFREEAYVDFANAAAGINGAYEKRRALSALLAVNNLKPAAVKALLEAAQGMDSDYELAELLVGVSKAGTVDASNVDEFFTAYASIDGDYEAHRVLTALLKGRATNRDVLLRILRASDRLGSDYERASLLVEVAGVAKMDDQLRAAFEKAADGVKSEYEYGRAMSALRKSARSL